MELTKEHKEILVHTEKTNFFCGDSDEMKDLCSLKLMEFAGKKHFVPDPYFKLTNEGRAVLADMREVGQV